MNIIFSIRISISISTRFSIRISVSINIFFSSSIPRLQKLIDFQAS